MQRNACNKYTRASCHIRVRRLGGQDPLDYISMYSNPGNAALNIPPHWHYISFGLSDLHGDNRVHLLHPPQTCDAAGNALPQPSGMGFELSFRLAKTAAGVVPAIGADGAPAPKAPVAVDRPPTWPANLLQSLARYVFQTGNRLCAGDNVPWGKSLDQQQPASSIQHMLIAPDPQLPRVQTPFGCVDFCQIVGVTGAELEQASRWNGNGVCQLLRKATGTGGEWLITDMQRSHSVFELFPDTLVQLEHDLEVEGSDLAGVNAEFAVRELRAADFAADRALDEAIEKCVLEEKSNKLMGTMKTEPLPLEDATDIADSDVAELQQPALVPKDEPPYRSFAAMSDSGSLGQSCPELVEQPMDESIEQAPAQCVRLEGLHLTLAPYAAKFLLMAIKDRIRHGRHFTFKCENRALTFVSESVSGAMVTVERPYGVMGYWTQVLIANDLVPQMIAVFRDLAAVSADKLELPKHFEWPDRRLRIVIDAPPPPPNVAALQRGFFA